MTRWVSSVIGATTKGPAVPSFSASASATTRAEASIMARLAWRSSRSVVVMPISGCRPQTPRKQRSARTVRSVSTAAAPTVTSASLLSVPPTSVTSTPGWSASATATGGLVVTTAARSSGGRWRATSSVVVPPSSRMTSPGRASPAAVRAISALAARSRSRRSA